MTTRERLIQIDDAIDAYKMMSYTLRIKDDPTDEPDADVSSFPGPAVALRDKARRLRAELDDSIAQSQRASDEFTTASEKIRAESDSPSPEQTANVLTLRDQALALSAQVNQATEVYKNATEEFRAEVRAAQRELDVFKNSFSQLAERSDDEGVMLRSGIHLLANDELPIRATTATAVLSTLTGRDPWWSKGASS